MRSALFRSLQPTEASQGSQGRRCRHTIRGWLRRPHVTIRRPSLGLNASRPTPGLNAMGTTTFSDTRFTAMMRSSSFKNQAFGGESDSANQTNTPHIIVTPPSYCKHECFSKRTEFRGTSRCKICVIPNEHGIRGGKSYPHVLPFGWPRCIIADS